MRIALFTDTYPDDVNGVARTLGLLVAHASRRGHEVALVTPRVSGGADPHAVWHHRLPGVPAPLYPELRLARGIGRSAARWLAAFAPQVVHVATEAPVGWSGRRWALATATPLVTSFHTNFPEYLGSYGLGRLEGLLWRYLRWFHGPAHATLCPSDATRQSLLMHGFHDRVGVWSRGVDAALFDPERRKTEVRARIAPGARRILVYVGRLAAEKRVDVVLEAFALVRARLGDDVALVLVGDGPFAGRLRRDAPEGTHFLGYLKGVALAEAYAAGDLFVCASETETFGNVVLEAIASGVPAIVVDRGGVTETVIPGRTGVRVPPGDVVAFADACVALLENDDERSRLADGARAEALTKGWNRILDGVLDVWEDCASQAPERWPTSTEPTPASRSGSRLRVGDRSFLRGIPWILRRRAGLSLPRRPAP